MLLILLADIRQRHNISVANILGHADVAPTRKKDPSALFAWRTLAQHGFGLWCGPPLPRASAGLAMSFLLAAIGYDPATPEASLDAFRLRFIQAAVL